MDREFTPIIMYHDIGRLNMRSKYRGLTLPNVLFRWHMQYLKERGYHGCTISELIDFWDGLAATPKKPVVVTFDDGYLSVYRHALKRMKVLGWRFTVYAVPNALGKKNFWCKKDNEDRLKIMDLQQLKICLQSGFEVGGHTMNHVGLGFLSEDVIYQEVSCCKMILDSLLSQDIRAFCYPFGNVSKVARDIVERCGYNSACTTEFRLAKATDDRLMLPRIPVMSWRALPGRYLVDPA